MFSWFKKEPPKDTRKVMFFTQKKYSLGEPVLSCGRVFWPIYFLQVSAYKIGDGKLTAGYPGNPKLIDYMDNKEAAENRIAKLREEAGADWTPLFTSGESE